MRLLIIEDEHRIANSLKKGLEQEHYAVDLAYTGPDGLDLALSEDYDLLIIDLMLPGLSGLEICRAIRQKQIHTPVLILTAKSQIQDKVTGLDTGADDYLTKPFSFDELLARIRALIRRPKKTLSNLLSANGLEINLTTYRVSRDHLPINLTAKEYALLEFLVRHHRQILSKDQIISHVWNYDANILPNTVEVYIRNLRRKIDLPFPKKTPLIHTIRGFGYRFGH